MKQFKKKWQTVFLIMLMAFFVTLAGGTKQTRCCSNRRWKYSEM